MDKAHSQNASGATDRVLSRRCTPQAASTGGAL